MIKFLSHPLLELCDVDGGGTPSRGRPEFFGGSIPWVKIGDMLQGVIRVTEETITPSGLASCSAKVFPRGTVLLSIFATIGRTAVLAVDAATNQAVAGIRVRDEAKLRVDYLRHYLQYSTSILASQSRGVAQANINLSILRNHQVPLPSPDEQRRIASVLDEADALRTKRRKALVQLREMSQAIFNDMFDEVNLDQRRGQRKPLGCLMKIVYRYPTYYDIQYELNGVMEVRGELIREDGDIDSSPARVRFISQSTAARFPKTRLDAGDLVISVRGTIGKVGLVPDSLAGANITANLMRLSPDRTMVDPVFMWHLTQTAQFRSKLVGASTTTTIATIKADDLKAIEVLVPSLEKQIEFRKRIETLSLLRACLRTWFPVMASAG